MWLTFTTIGFLSLSLWILFVEIMETERIEEEMKEKVLKLVLEPIHFPTGSYVLPDEAKAYLDRELVPILQQYQKIRVSISGHTDNVGQDAQNLTLSNHRARSIHDFLIETGIASHRLEYIGYGEAKPIDTNETLEGRERNRRVEFVLML